jgi:hypothetical protein
MTGREEGEGFVASFFETGPDCHSLPELFCPVSSEQEELALLSLLMVRWYVF